MVPVLQRNYIKALHSLRIKTGEYTKNNLGLTIKDECKKIVGEPRDKIRNGKTK